ncbi:MAG: hypothetical protein P4L83_18805 [Nevskia sp.]|nr:hypothetical protein [Nevskia sp.]
MLTQAVWTSLRILAFRAGPEDFPYDPSHRLTAVCVVFGVVANAALASQLAQAAVAAQKLPAMPSPLALSMLGVATVLAMGLFTQAALRARRLENRFQQTFNALLATSSILALVLVIPVGELRPFLPVAEEFTRKLQANPDLLNNPGNVPEFPGWAMLMSMLIPGLLVWQFALTAFIYRRAANTQTGGGIFIALLCLLAVTSFKALFSALTG